MRLLTWVYVTLNLNFKKPVHHTRQPPFALDKQDGKVTVHERTGEILVSGASLCFMDEPVFGSLKSGR